MVEKRFDRGEKWLTDWKRTAGEVVGEKERERKPYSKKVKSFYGKTFSQVQMKEKYGEKENEGEKE